VNAEGRQVYKDEYIFTKKPGEITTSLQESKLQQHYNIIDYGVGGVRLVRPRRQGFAIEVLGRRPVVNYDPENDRCKRSPVEGFTCEPNWYVSIQVVPTDSLYKSGKLWGLNGTYGINAPAAWDYSVGKDVVVAIIDTGTNFEHPDLAPNIWRNPREVRDNGKDDDANGYIDDSHGFNAVSGKGLPVDDNGHGSHVAGTICAYGSGGGDLVGVNWNCKILTIKFLGANGGGSLFAAIKGIDYMVEIKRQYNIENMVSNNSWGGGGFSQALKNSIIRARDEGIVFVTAAGNDGRNTDGRAHYPSGYQLRNILRIGAIGSDGTPASFSNYGTESVDISGPGVGIYSASHRGSGYIALSGTSMAAPHASGIVALLLSRESALSPEKVIERILSTGRRLDSLEGKNKTEKTLDAYRALTNQVTEDPPPPVIAPDCRIKRFKRCKRGCKEQYKGQRRLKRKCVRKCRGTHDCPWNWRNLFLEWTTWTNPI